MLRKYSPSKKWFKTVNIHVYPPFLNKKINT